MSNSLGRIFRITTFGESHGRCVGAVVDGCPAGLALASEDIQKELDKRRPQASSVSTQRAEEDKVDILSGIFNNRTTGAPITLLVWNRDADSSEYERIKETPRPGHADYPASLRYGGFNDYRGGGRFSGRITASFVMAGAVAKKLLSTMGVEIIAHTVAIGNIKAMPKSIDEIRDNRMKNLFFTADIAAVDQMLDVVQMARGEGDSVGGIIEGIALNVPAGLGEPVFGTLEGELAYALFAIPAVKGVEFGLGFDVARKRGSDNNDQYRVEKGKVVTLTNNSGGILGGISNGMPIIARVAVKPTPSISIAQRTVNLRSLDYAEILVKGRHDACIVPRAVVVVESMMATVLADFALRGGLIGEVIK